MLGSMDMITEYTQSFPECILDGGQSPARALISGPCPARARLIRPGSGPGPPEGPKLKPGPGPGPQIKARGPARPGNQDQRQRPGKISNLKYGVD